MILDTFITALRMRKLFKNGMTQYYRKLGSTKQKEHSKAKMFTTINAKKDARISRVFLVYEIVILECIEILIHYFLNLYAKI